MISAASHAESTCPFQIKNTSLFPTCTQLSTVYEVQLFHKDYPAQIKADPSFEIYNGAKKISSQTWQDIFSGPKQDVAILKIKNLQSDSYFQVVVKKFPLDFPLYRSQGLAQTGFFLLSPFRHSDPDKNGYLLVIDQTGQLVFFKKTPKGVLSFKSHTTSQGFVFSYSEVEKGYKDVSLWGTHTVLNVQGQEIEKIYPSANESFGPPGYDLHDVLYFSEKHFTAHRSEPRFNFLGECYLQSFVEEWENGKKVFSWSTLDLPQNWRWADTFGYIEKVFCKNRFHLNSYQKLPSGYLFSLRNINAILFQPTVFYADSWVFGGPGNNFNIPEHLQFFYQHSPILQDGELTVFDNHRDLDQTKKSRVMRYALDITNKRILKSSQIYKDGFYSPFMGNIQTLKNNRLLIGFGWRQIGNWDLAEITSKGSLRFGLYFTDNDFKTYQVHKLESHLDSKRLFSGFFK